MKVLKWLLVTLVVSGVVHAKPISKKDVRLDLPKMTDATIEVEKVNHLQRTNAVQITLKNTRTKNDGTNTYYSCAVKDAEGNILQEIDTFAMPKEAGTKERRQIPISDLPSDFKPPITIIFKIHYLCEGDVCKDMSP